jgi:hypothetical protein
MFQTRAIHDKIDLYLAALRQYGGFSDRSLLPKSWTLVSTAWDQKAWSLMTEPNAISSLLSVQVTSGQVLADERCTLRITTFSGEPVLTMEDLHQGIVMLPNKKYLVFYDCGWGKHPDNVRMRSGPFLLHLSQPGKCQLSLTTDLGSGQVAGTHEGCYAVNFESTGRFPVITGYAYQFPPGEYHIDGLLRDITCSML